MKIVTRIVWVVSILMLVQACSGIKASQDFDQGDDFSGLKSFSWKPNENNEYGISGNDLLARRIVTAIENNLIAKNYIKADSGKADFYVSYHASVEQKISSSNLSTSMTLGRSSSGRRYRGMGISTGSDIEAYDQGKLLIDVTDVATNKLVWRGVSTQRVVGHSTAEKTTELINATVEKVLLQFPSR